jgi:RND family efflux transporter MFP subunit
LKHRELSTRAGAVPVVLVVVIAIAMLAAGFWIGSRRTAGAPPDEGQSTAPAGLWTCGMHPQVIQDGPGICPICHMDLTPLDADASAGGVTIDPVVVQNMGLRVAPVEERALQRSVRAYGTLMEPEPLHRDVTLRVGGTIVRLDADSDGKPVEAGDPLFDLYSPELTVAAEELIAAARASRGSASSPTVSALRDAARRRLALLDVPSAQIDELEQMESAPATFTFRSPVRAHVTGLNVSKGSAVAAGDIVLRLADNSTLWVETRVAERDLSGVRVGLPARVRVDAFPGRVIDGEVSFVHPHLDMESRTALVRLSVPNADRSLRENMFASVEIALDLSGAGDALVVPREAVIDTGLRRVVFVARGNGRFEPVDVALGANGEGGLVQVLSGLARGDTVVVSGQFLLDAESRIRESVRRHLDRGLSGHETPPATATGAPAPPGEAPQAEVDALFARYLEIAARLGGVSEDADRFDAAPLARAARELAAAANGPTRDLATKLAESADALARTLGEERRRAFAPLSEIAIALADRAPPSRAIAPSLYVVHCPMAPGSWLQSRPGIENPYYATAMKACGEVVRAIAAPR